MATVAALLVVTVYARTADAALDEAAARTLRDYTGYAGRLMGSEMLRRFAEQRARVLIPVVGMSGRGGRQPSLDEIVQLGDRELRFGTRVDSARGYFRLDLRTGAMAGSGAVAGELADRIADTLRHLAHVPTRARDPRWLVLEHGKVSYGIAYATYADSLGKPVAIFGLSYGRGVGAAYWAERVFNETPLLPTSYASASWDDNAVRPPGQAKNDSLLAVRIGDQTGRIFWESPGGASRPEEEKQVSTMITTSAVGLTIETTLRPGGQRALVPMVARRAQHWSMRTLFVLTILLAAISLLALFSERAVARARRTEAMEQLALGLRHELNNALASVLLNAELAIEQRDMDDAMRERVQAIIEQAERMRGVLRRLQQRERLDVIVPYLGEGFMVDLSAREGELTTEVPHER
jgi:signal transduction histidine kinase